MYSLGDRNTWPMLSAYTTLADVVAVIVCGVLLQLDGISIVNGIGLFVIGFTALFASQPIMFVIAHYQKSRDRAGGNPP